MPMHTRKWRLPKEDIGRQISVRSRPKDPFAFTFDLSPMVSRLKGWRGFKTHKENLMIVC